MQEIKERSPLKTIGILPQKFIPQTQEVRTDQFKKQRLTRRVSQTMGRQRNNPQMKGKEEASETMLNEKEASQLSDTEFKAMVIRKLTDLFLYFIELVFIPSTVFFSSEIVFFISSWPLLIVSISFFMLI